MARERFAAGSALDAAPTLRLAVSSHQETEGWLHETRGDRVVRRPSRAARHNEYVSRIVAVNDAGEPVIEYRDYAVAWEDEKNNDGPVTSSLAGGRFRLVKKKDGATLVDVLSGDVSDNDLREFNLRHAVDLMLPTAPVASGGTWKVRGDVLQRYFTRLGEGRQDHDATGTLNELSGDRMPDGLGRFAAITIVWTMRGRLGTHSTIAASSTITLTFDRLHRLVTTFESTTLMTSKDGSGTISGEAEIRARVERQPIPPVAAVDGLGEGHGP
jgi:hypothetical protein